MVYETSYENGNQPFRPDVKRGYWASPNDYIWASLGLVFKMDIFFMTKFFLFSGGLNTIVPYLICLCLYVVPIMIIQAFMGQFSSSGFISSLRLSPIFKGMGYVSLLLNSLVLSYYTIYGAVALFFLASSFLPTLPFNCGPCCQQMNGELNICEESADFYFKYNRISSKRAFSCTVLFLAAPILMLLPQNIIQKMHQFPSQLYYRYWGSGQS